MSDHNRSICTRSHRNFLVSDMIRSPESSFKLKLHRLQDNVCGLATAPQSEQELKALLVSICRIKKKCLSWKPACLDQPLPKPGNSVAIRLLKVIKIQANEAECGNVQTFKRVRHEYGRMSRQVNTHVNPFSVCKERRKVTVAIISQYFCTRHRKNISLNKNIIFKSANATTIISLFIFQ